MRHCSNFCESVKCFFEEMCKTSAPDVLDRLRLVFGVDNDSALAEVMKVGRSTLGSWRTRPRVPYKECVNLAVERGISLDWLLTGRGTMKLGVTAGTPREAELLQLMRELPEAEQQALLGEAQLRRNIFVVEAMAHKLFPEMIEDARKAAKARREWGDVVLPASVPKKNG